MNTFLIFLRGFFAGMTWTFVGIMIDPKMRRVVLEYMGIGAKGKPRKRGHA